MPPRRSTSLPSSSQPCMMRPCLGPSALTSGLAILRSYYYSCTSVSKRHIPRLILLGVLAVAPAKLAPSAAVPKHNYPSPHAGPDPLILNFCTPSAIPGLETAASGMTPLDTTSPPPGPPPTTKWSRCSPLPSIPSPARRTTSQPFPTSSPSRLCQRAQVF
ncbi:hypothetical protein DFH94DRAFT_732876 [Russula ochroleuca]|jgi:hypothetical protein|uniref:Uncharacterized protein n=1 Tax=Russula ochroleuca TaxID=152965 RepID=A0A9P5MYA3_9AGAM|nr:hypothetical protein DFH94DRAFT_732876 [Russula ochroleuca]